MNKNYWVEVKLEDVAEIMVGFAFKSKDFSDKGIRLVRGDNITKGELRWGDKTRYWSKITPDIEKYLLSDKDILISMDGSLVGKNVAKVREEDLPLLLVQRVARLRSKENMDQDLLYFLVDNPRFIDYVDSVKTGTSIPHISATQIKNYRFHIPNKKVQRKISNILSSLSEKIIINKRINQTLEEMAMTLYKDWFINFSPFQDGEFKDSEVGVIPKGWEVVSLSDLLIMSKKGITPKYTESLENSIIVLNQKCIRDKKISLKPARRHDLSKKVSTDKYLLPYDILINSTGLGTLGRVAQLLGNLEPVVVDSHIRICRPDPEKCSPIYLGQMLKRLEPTLQTMTEGSTGQAELSADLLSLKIIFPPLNLQRKYEEKVLDWLLLTLKNEKENEDLFLTRDYLISRLLSGEIELKEAEKQVEEVF